MTDPIKIPLLNQKFDASGNPVPLTHADLPPAAGIANTMTVHEHHTVMQALTARFNALLQRHTALIAEHEQLKAYKANATDPIPEKSELTDKTLTELKAKTDAWQKASAERSDPSKINVSGKIETTKIADAKIAETNAAAAKPAETLTPASQPNVFVPKVPAPVTTVTPPATIEVKDAPKTAN